MRKRHKKAFRLRAADILSVMLSVLMVFCQLAPVACALGGTEGAGTVPAISGDTGTDTGKAPPAEPLDDRTMIFALSVLEPGDTAGIEWYEPDADSYTISDETELAGLAALVNGTAVSEGAAVPAVDFTGKTITLANDITLTGEWTPIGSASHIFNGDFEGGSHTVGGLSIAAGGADDQALFGFAGGNAVIRDLTASGSVTSAVAGRYVAGVVAYNQGLLQNVTNHAAVTGAYGASCTVYIGGVAAYSTGDLEDCQNTALVGNGTVYSTSQSIYTGGVVGYSSAALTDCANSGAVTVTCKHRYVYAGGVAGYAASAAERCANTAQVSADTSYSSSPVIKMGGVIGVLNAKSLNLSCNTGPVVTATAGGTRYIGGLVGSGAGGATIGNGCSTGGVSAAAGGTLYQGGIVGYISGGSCYNTYAAGTAELPTAGSALGNFHCNYYLADATASEEDAAVNGGRGRTDADLQSAEFLPLVGYAFAAQPGAYPRLHWQTDPGSDFVIFDYRESTLTSIDGEAYEQTDNLVRVAREGDMVAAPAVGTKAAYALEGWYTDAACAPETRAAFDGDGKAAVAAGATLYAHWEMAKVQVTFDYRYEEDGNPVSQEVPAVYNQPVVPPDAARDGYTLVGWYTGTEDGEGVTLSDKEFDFTTCVKTPFTLYAKWREGLVGSDFAWYTADPDASGFTVRTADELMALADLVNGNAPAEVSEAPVDFGGRVVRLANDIDLSGAVWVAPIGKSAATPFRGTFDGANRLLAGFSITRSAGCEGLFGHTENAVIRNLLLNGSVDAGADTGGLVGHAAGTLTLDTVTANLAVTGGGDNIGGLVGSTEGDAVFSNIIIRGSAAGTGDCAGGILGRAGAGAVFTNCVSEAGASVGGAGCIGGLAGYVTGAAACTDVTMRGAVTGTGSCTGGMLGMAAGGGAFTNCVMETGASVSGAGYTGGLAGSLQAPADGFTLDGCQNNGAVGGSNFVGGLFGRVGTAGVGTITGSGNTGAVTATAGDVGGLLGTGVPLAGTGAEIRFQDCRNSGAVSTGAGARIGGIAGSVGDGGNVLTASFTACTNTGAVSNIGTSNIGGILGYAYGKTGSKFGIRDCVNSGAVSGGSNAGGIAGYLQTGTIKYCANTADVTGGQATGGILGQANSSVAIEGCENTGAQVNGGSFYTGGILGQCYSSSVVTITASRNTAAVTGAAASGMVGGVLGGSSGTSNLTACSNSGAVQGYNQVAGVVGAMGSGTVSDCYNAGAVTASTDGTCLASGITAYQQSGMISLVRNSYNCGVVTGAVTGGVTGTADPSKTAVIRCYYLDTSVETAVDAAVSAAKTADAFASFAVAYLLDNGGSGNRENVWTQSAEDPYPVFQTAAGQGIYKISLSAGAGGSVSTTVRSGTVLSGDGYFRYGDSICLNVTPDEGQIVTLLSVKDREGDTVYSGNQISAYQFAGEDDYTVTASFGVLVPGMQYTVTFNSDGGSDVPPQVISAGDQAQEPSPDPERTETVDDQEVTYGFAGWYTDEALTNEYDFNTAVTGDMTLHAKWVQGEETVPPELIQSGMTITTGGCYVLESGCFGTITVDTTDPVTLCGAQDEGGAFVTYTDLTVLLTGGDEVTIQNLKINDTRKKRSGVEVEGQDNVLYLDGANEIYCDGDGSNALAPVHVPTGSSLRIDGLEGGSLYLEKQGYSAGIGSNDGEACGTVTIDGGRIQIWSQMIGYALGSSSGSGNPLFAGDSIIRINGGEVDAFCYGGNAKVAAADTVSIGGGVIILHHSQSAQKTLLANTLNITGGSLKLSYGTSIYPADASVASLPLTATNGSDPVYRLKLNLADRISANGYGNTVFSVAVDGESFYEGTSYLTRCNSVTSAAPNRNSYTAVTASDTDLYGMLYLYLPGVRHIVTITDKDGESVTCVATRADPATEFSLHSAYSVSFSGGNAAVMIDGEPVTGTVAEIKPPEDDPEGAPVAEAVTFTVQAEEGYTVTAVNAPEGATLEQNEDGSYRLSGLTGDATVTIETEEVVLPGEVPEGESPLGLNGGGAGTGDGIGSGDGNGAPSADGQGDGAQGDGGQDAETTSDQSAVSGQDATAADPADDLVIAAPADTVQVREGTAVDEPAEQPTEEAEAAGAGPETQTQEQAAPEETPAEEEVPEKDEPKPAVFDVVVDLVKNNPQATAATGVVGLSAMGFGGFRRFFRFRRNK